MSLSSFPPRSPLPPASVGKLGKKILLFRRKPRTECLSVDICILMCLILLLPFTYLSLKFSRHLNSLEKSIYFPWISAVVTAAFFFFFFSFRFQKQARQQDVICFSSAEEALPSPFPEGG